MRTINSWALDPRRSGIIAVDSSVSFFVSAELSRVLYTTLINVIFVCPGVVSVIVNDDQQDATILASLFIPNQLYMFRAMSSPIIRST